MAAVSDFPVNRIIQGDCLSVMQSIPSGLFSMTLTSPPYEDARLYKPLEFTAAGQDWVDWMVPRVVEMCRVTAGLVFINMAGKRRDWKYSPVVEWLVADLTRNHGIICGPAPYVFYRVGIPGSGSKKYHRRDWEPVYAFALPENVPPKWSDNTAMGHPPKWAPGGEMSNRLPNGARVNQWGHPINSGATVVDDDGSVRSEGKRPSHVLADRAAFGRPGKTRQKNGEMEARPKAKACGTSRRANGKYKDRPTNSQFSHSEDGSVKGGYDRDICAIADPGNVIQEHYTAEQVAAFLADPGDVVKCNVGGGVMGDDLCHDNEAPFPESLAEFFIRSYCQEGGVVFDPFCGSGTVPKVAQKWGRKFVGVDVRESQVKLARRRLNEYGQPLFMEAQ